VQLGDGTGVFGAAHNTPLSSAPVASVIGDFNGDGNADVLWRDPSNGQNAMWLMNGTTKTLGAIIESAPTGWQVIQ